MKEAECRKIKTHRKWSLAPVTQCQHHGNKSKWWGQQIGVHVPHLRRGPAQPPWCVASWKDDSWVSRGPDRPETPDIRILGEISRFKCCTVLAIQSTPAATFAGMMFVCNSSSGRAGLGPGAPSTSARSPSVSGSFWLQGLSLALS